MDTNKTKYLRRFDVVLKLNMSRTCFEVWDMTIRRQKFTESIWKYIEYEHFIQSIQWYRLLRATLASAYMLYCLSAMWSQLEKIEQSLKRVSTNSNMLLKNTKD